MKPNNALNLRRVPFDQRVIPMKDAQLKSAMDAHAALFLLDSVAEMLSNIPHIDNKLSANVSKWQAQLIAERNRMLPLSDDAYNAKSNRLAGDKT